MRFFSPLLGKSSVITQATYPCTIDGASATIDGFQAACRGAFENLNNDIYEVVDRGPLFVGAGDTIFHAPVIALGAQLLLSGFSGYNSSIIVDATTTQVDFLNEKFNEDTYDVATDFGAKTAKGKSWIDQSSNGVITSAPSSAKEATVNRDGEFEFYNDYYSATISPLTDAMTFHIWLKIDDLSRSETFLGQYEYSVNEQWYFIYNSGSDRLEFNCYGPTGTFYRSRVDSFSSKITEGEWFILTMTQDSVNGAQFYVNGAPIFTVNGSQTVLKSLGTQLYIGTNGSPSDSYDLHGSIRMLAIYDFVFTDDEVIEFCLQLIKNQLANYPYSGDRMVIGMRGQSNLQGADPTNYDQVVTVAGESFAYNSYLNSFANVQNPIYDIGNNYGGATNTYSIVPDLCVELNSLQPTIVPIIAVRAYGGTAEISEYTPNWSTEGYLNDDCIYRTKLACINVGLDAPEFIVSVIGETDAYIIDDGYSTRERYKAALIENLLKIRGVWPEVKIVIAQSTYRASYDTIGSIAVREVQQEVTDLYDWIYISTISSTFHPNGWMMPDNTHWTWEGCRASGIDLATIISGEI